MGDRRATRYAAFFESADKVTSSSTKRTKSPARKSPSRNEASKKEATGRKSPARVENIKKERKSSPVKKERKSSKSPGRGRPPKSKSPARTAPKKETKVKKEEKEEKKPATKNKASSKNTSPNVVIEKLNTSPKSKSTKAKITEVDSSDVELSPRPRRRTRQDTKAEKKSEAGSVSASRSVVDASPEYSDADVEHEVSFKRRVASKLDELKEFGGTLGCTLLLLLYPLVTYALAHLCTARSCVLKTPNWADFKQVGTYYNADLAKIVVPWLLAVTTLNIFPLGRTAKLHTDRGYAEYQFNGLTLSVLTVGAIVGAEYLKYPVVDLLYRNSSQLLLILLLNAALGAVLAFVRSRYVAQVHLNPFAKTGSVVQDFFVGREINPKLFSLIDVKLVHYHVSLITTLVLNGIFIYKNLKFPVLQAEVELQAHEKALYLLQHAKFEVVPLVVSGLIILYVLDLLVFEHHLSKAFELQYEGVGADLLLRDAIFPFNFSLIAKYALEHKLKLEWYVLTLIVVEFVVALVLKRLSNKSKHDFRLNPTSSKSLSLKSIPTFQGRRILVDGLWKIVRQPNYTAELLLHLSLLLVLIGRFAVPPLLATLFNVLLLLHRSVRLDERHASRYESAWQRYCQEVKYVLLPRIY